MTGLTNNGSVENLELWLMMEGAAVRSSEKIRLLVFSFFFIVLIAFAALYSPVDAVSRPANRGNSAVMAAK